MIFLTVVDLQDPLRDRECLDLFTAGVVICEVLRGIVRVCRLKFCFLIWVEIVSRMKDCLFKNGYGFVTLIALSTLVFLSTLTFLSAFLSTLTFFAFEAIGFYTTLELNLISGTNSGCSCFLKSPSINCPTECLISSLVITSTM